MFGLEKYRDIFGIPREGFHQQRIPILDIALWDVVGTIGLAFISSWLFSISMFKSFLGWLVLGEILHVVFDIRRNDS